MQISHLLIQQMLLYLSRKSQFKIKTIFIENVYPTPINLRQLDRESQWHL